MPAMVRGAADPRRRVDTVAAMARHPKRTWPQRPNLPVNLDAAPPVLAAEASWESVAAGADLEVPGTVADVELVGVRLTGVDLSARHLTGLRARDVVFDRCDLSGAILDGASLARVVFSGCRLTGTMLSATRLADVVIEDSVAKLGNFRAARATLLFIERTVLVEADFYLAQLTDSAILDCDLTGANFRDVRVDALCLHGSTLERLVGAASLAGAAIDMDQLFPLGAALVAALGIKTTDRPREP